MNLSKVAIFACSPAMRHSGHTVSVFSFPYQLVATRRAPTMSILGEIPLSGLVNQHRPLDAVSTPEEEIIIKRGRREVPCTPPKREPPHDDVVENEENRFSGSQSNVSPMTKCIRSLAPSPPRTKRRLPQAPYSLRRRLANLSPEPSSIDIRHDYSPTPPYKLRRLDVVKKTLHDSGIDVITPSPTKESAISKSKVDAKSSAKRSTLSKGSNYSVKKKNTRKATTQRANQSRRRLCF